MLIDTTPEGFRYQPDLISAAEEQQLLTGIRPLPFEPFKFQGYLARRRVVSFGLRYDYEDYRLHRSEAIPDLLLPIRERAAEFAGLDAADLVHALVTEYSPGTPIGWHRDRCVYRDIVGVSLLSPCTLRFRRRAGSKWDRHSLVLEPRSAYILRGAARSTWEHSIPEVSSERYSITFRSLEL